MTDCKYWNESWGPSFAGRCSAPDDVSTNATNRYCMSPQTCPYLLEPLYKKKSQMTKMTAEMFGANTPIVPDETLEEWLKDEPVKKMTEKELIQKQIEELQAKLEELENQKSPAEEAYKKVYGAYPTEKNYNQEHWDGFQKGYNAAYKEPEDTVWKSVALRFGEKLSDIGPCGYYEFSPDEWFEWAVNTYETFSDDVVNILKKEKQVTKLKEKEWTYKVTDEKGETNPYKNYMNSVKNLQEKNWYVDAKSLVKPETLYSLIADWWDEIFTNGNPSGQNIESLVEQIEKWLPKPIEETCGMKDWDNAWTIGYNNYRNTLMEKLK